MTFEYQPPGITDLGSVAQLTLGNKPGDATDQAFPVNTPKENLTFS